MSIKYSKLKTSVAVLGIATLAGVGAANVLPMAAANADTGIQLAACNPCGAQKKCGACNPCAAKKRRNPCNPCKAKKKSGACNPCAAKKRCNPCNPCSAKTR